MNEKKLKQNIFERLAGIANMLGSAVRLRIIQVLSQSPKTVDELSNEIDVSIANTSQHLQKLLKEGFVSVEKIGVSRRYSLTSESITTLLEDFANVAHEISPQLVRDVDELIPVKLRAPEEMKTIQKKINNGAAILLDVRPISESTVTPVKNALCIPVNNLKKEISSLPNKEIFIFCRGRYCLMGNKAVQLLRKNGFEAHRLMLNWSPLQKIFKK